MSNSINVTHSTNVVYNRHVQERDVIHRHVHNEVLVHKTEHKVNHVYQDELNMAKQRIDIFV